MGNNFYLGIDTSNYTSSCALYNSDKDEFISRKQLLPVEHGQLGLRQSDAVFHHVRNLPPLLSELCDALNADLSAVGYSYAPRDTEGSYMPCFCVGKGFADVISASFKANKYSFSHQAGHIAAALWSSGMTKLADKEFLAFHVSGGTTDLLHVSPDKEKIFNIETIASSLDLKAGQAIDRVGVMLELGFPAGVELDKLSLNSEKIFKIKPFIRDGSCSFSGIENKCRQMLNNNEAKEDIAKYCISYIYSAVKQMTEYALLKNGDLPIIYAGGVMSNSFISKKIKEEFNGYFAEPYYSSDNAAGTSYLAYLKENLK